MKRIFELSIYGILLSACAKAPGPSPSHHPNILLITVDTLRADHLRCYGYRRATSPNIDALARTGVLFDQAYTFWPKTRASFVMIHTGRTAGQNGYSGSTPRLLPFNPTIASLLEGAGYTTAAIVDNANVAAALGYSKGFDSYTEVWEEPGVKTEMDGALAITRLAVRFLGQAHAQPFFLWLHYVNPHAPYTPPPPNDSLFLDEGAQELPHLRVVSGYHGGIPRPLFVPGHRNLAFYVAQYDGEVRTVDTQVGEVLKSLEGPLLKETAVVFTSDHGESLGEHDYYFDHGEDLFDPCLRIPLILRLPGGQAGQRVARLSSTLDLLPTLVALGGGSNPPGLLGESLVVLAEGRARGKGGRLFAQNDRGLSATWDDRFKLVEAPTAGSGPPIQTFYDRQTDPQEAKDVSKAHPEELSQARRQLDYFLARENQDRAGLRRLVESAPGQPKLSRDACERLRALGYVQECSN